MISRLFTETLQTPFAASLSARVPRNSMSALVPHLPDTSREQGTNITINYVHRLWVSRWVQPSGKRSRHSSPCWSCFVHSLVCSHKPFKPLCKTQHCCRAPTEQQLIHSWFLLAHISYRVPKAIQGLVLHVQRCVPTDTPRLDFHSVPRETQTDLIHHSSGNN